MTVATFTGQDPAASPGLSDADRQTVARLVARSESGSGYLKLQATRPQTIGYALTDSPIGQLAWIVEKFQEWTDDAAELPEDAVDRDRLLANVSLYWFTRSGASGAHALYESLNAERDWGAQGSAPVGMAVFGATPIARPLLDPKGTTSTSRSSPSAGTSPRWNSPRCWSTTGARSLPDCAEPVVGEAIDRAIHVHGDRRQRLTSLLIHGWRGSQGRRHGAGAAPARAASPTGWVAVGTARLSFGDSRDDGPLRLITISRDTTA